MNLIVSPLTCKWQMEYQGSCRHQRVARIGVQADDKKRPIKVSLENEKEKILVLRSLVALKNNPVYYH